MDAEYLIQARNLCKLSVEALAERSRLTTQQVSDLENKKLQSPAAELERIVTELELLGCYFTFKSDKCTGVNLYSYSTIEPIDITPAEISQLHAIDARSFLRSASIVDRANRAEDAVLSIALPLVFLCCHSMELSLKSYLLRETGDFNSIQTAPQRGTHDLKWLLDQCRKFDCEKFIALSDADYHRVTVVNLTHSMFRNRYRDKVGPREMSTRESLMAITQKICRYSEPPIYNNNPAFSFLGRGPLVLEYIVPAGPTPKKPPTPK